MTGIPPAEGQHHGADQGDNVDASASAPPASGQPIIAWDAALSGALLAVLVFELLGLLYRLTPPWTNWLTVPQTYVAIAIVIGSALVVIVRVIHRRISFWTVLIFLVAAPFAALLGAFMLLAAALRQ